MMTSWSSVVGKERYRASVSCGANLGGLAPSLHLGAEDDAEDDAEIALCLNARTGETLRRAPIGIRGRDTSEYAALDELRFAMPATSKD
jgi:hypothetical protein